MTEPVSLCFCLDFALLVFCSLKLKLLPRCYFFPSGFLIIFIIGSLEFAYQVDLLDNSAFFEPRGVAAITGMQIGVSDDPITVFITIIV